MTPHARLRFFCALVLGGALSAQVGCAGEGADDEGCAGGKCDSVDPENAACGQQVSDASGTGRDAASILGNNDQFARFVLVEGDSCPTSTTEVMAKFNEIDACGSDANGTMVVNEKSSHDAIKNGSADESLLAAVKNNNRAVVSRQCAIPPEPEDMPAEMKPCVGADVSEFDFVTDQCADSNNTPECFLEQSGESFFSSAECLACLTREDGRLHKDDLRTGERRCLDREAVGDDGNQVPAFNLLFSTFSSIDKISDSGLEVIAFDETEGVFNYYKENQGGWAFMGNSKDFQEGKGGFCKGCHPSGGLVMKELPSPWMNWEISGDVPHSREVIDNNKDFFGSPFPLGGEGLEISIVRPGNEVMNRKRLERLSARVAAAKGDRSSERGAFSSDDAPVFTKDEMHELLKPLFCTEQITIVNGTFGTDGIFKPDMLESSSFISLPSGEYSKVIADLGQVRGSGPLTSPDSSSQLARPTNGDVFDGFSEGLYRMMVNQNLLTNEFIQDVHIIDFTRPLFSDDRCGLLEFAPEITVADIKAADTLAAAIEAGFVRELEAASRDAAAEELLANLKDPNGADARNAAVKTFLDACTARASSDANGLMTDVVKMVELMRQETEQRLEIIESFLAADVWPSIPSMARDFTRWNPTTCQLE